MILLSGVLTRFLTILPNLNLLALSKVKVEFVDEIDSEDEV